MGRTGRFVGAAAAAVLAVTVSGCGAILEGGGGTAPDGSALPSMKQLWSTMRAATLAAESGHVTGFLTQDGEALSLDVEGLRDSSNQRIRLKGTDGSATVITVGKRTWIKADWDFLTSVGADSRVATRMKNKFIKMSPKESKGFADLTFGDLVDGILEQETLGVTDTIGGSVSKRTQGDREVFVATDLKGNEFWVDTETDLLVRLVAKDDQPAELNFDRWNDARTFTKPAKVFTL